MPRLRGVRRACLLIASALPLLADVPETSGGNGSSSNTNNNTQTAAQEVRRKNATLISTISSPPPTIHQDDDENNLATRSENWAQTWEYGQHHNVVVVPFRPYAPITSTTTDPTEDNTTNQQRVQSSDQESAAVSSVNEVEEDATRTDPSQRQDKDDDILPEETETDGGNNLIESVSTESTTKGDEDTNTDTTENVDTTGMGDNNISETDTEDVVDETQLPVVEDDPATMATEDTQPIEDDYEDETVKSVQFDFASKSAGALILEKSAGWKGASDLLNSDGDRYALIPCAESSKSVVVSLSEDVYVKTVVLANYERFSSTVKDFQLLGSQTMGTWVDLGMYTAKPGGGKQEFELKEYSWARYLKLRVLSHHGNEHYLTISQLSVFGDTMLQGFHEQWEEEQVQDETEAIEEPADKLGAEGVDSNPPVSLSGERRGRSTANPLDISSFPANDPCIPAPGSICPKDLSFEQLVFLYSTNQSHADRMSFLSSSTSCRSLRKYEHDRFPEIHVQSRSPVSTIAMGIQDSRGGSHVLSINGKAFELDTAQLPIIGHIQNLIKSTSGVDLELSTVNLLGGKEATGEKEIKHSKDSDHGNVEQASSAVTDQESIADSSDTDSTLKEVQSNVHEPQASLRDDSLNDLDLDSLIKYLERLPSSSCIKEINFAEYRKRVASNKVGNTGPNNGQSTGGGAELQPIFKKLTDEIKALQSTLGVQEGFLKGAVSCYQKVLLELIIHQQETQWQTEKRMDDLEHAIITYMTWLRFVEDCITSVRAFCSSLSNAWSSMVLSLPPNMLEIVVVFPIVILALYVTRLLYLASWRWLSARRQRGDPSKENRKQDSTTTVESERLSSTKDCLADGKSEYSSLSMHRGKEGEEKADLIPSRDAQKSSRETSEVSNLNKCMQTLSSETTTSQAKSPLREEAIL